MPTAGVAVSGLSRAIHRSADSRNWSGSLNARYGIWHESSIMGSSSPFTMVAAKACRIPLRSSVSRRCVLQS